MIIVFEMSILKGGKLDSFRMKAQTTRPLKINVDPICFCVGFISAREHLHFQITMQDLILRS